MIEPECSNPGIATIRIADKFDLPGGRVMIRRGSHGRTKTVDLYGQAASLLARVKELLHS